MTLTAAGFPGTVRDEHWSKVLSLMGNDGTVGFNVSAAAGDRTVSVTSGMSNVGGLLVESDAAETQQLEPNNSESFRRIDRIILRANWESRSYQLTYRRGTPSPNPQPPDLAPFRNPGVQWEVSLAKVELDPGQGALTGGNITSENTPPPPGFYYINTLATAPDPRDGALIYYQPDKSLLIGTPSSGYQEVANWRSTQWLNLPGGGSGWSHSSQYQSDGRHVTLQIDVTRVTGAMDGNDVDLGTLPSGARPSRELFATIMNQQAAVPDLIRVRPNGLVTALAISAATNQRIRGLVSYMV